jgi:N-acetyl sugar amidotransferase
MRRCKRCNLPETHETITFDDEGVCVVCRSHEIKAATNWGERKLQLDQLIDQYRDKGEYDCIVPFSGGKDSTWVLWYLTSTYGIKPLVVTFDHGFLRPRVMENTKRTMRRLGVDHHMYTPRWTVVRELMTQSLKDKGDFCWHCHTGIFAYPMWIALETKTPLVVWGEQSAEYTAYYTHADEEEVDETRFNRINTLGITADDMRLRLRGAVRDRDMRPFTYPPAAALRDLGVRSICLGSYVEWDTHAQVEQIKRELGWQEDEVENVPPQYGYDKIECYLQGVRDYLKYLKRGYLRPSHLAAIDLRRGRITRLEAEKMIAEYEGKRPPSLEVFLDLVEMTDSEFHETALRHVVEPWVSEVPVIVGKRTSDFEEWSRATSKRSNRSMHAAG